MLHWVKISKTIGFTEKAKEALNRVGLAHRLDHYPSQLSGGEATSLIARAFVSNPTILIADEPSGNLDQDTGEQVMDILFKQAEEQYDIDLGNSQQIISRSLQAAVPVGPW